MAKKKVEEEKEYLRRYEVFLNERLLEYLNAKSDNTVTEEKIARVMKALRIFVEQTVRRIAWRNKWTWAAPNVVVKKKKVALSESASKPVKKQLK
jgi:hypothetical protein